MAFNVHNVMVSTNSVCSGPGNINVIHIKWQTTLN